MEMHDDRAKTNRREMARVEPPAGAPEASKPAQDWVSAKIKAAIDAGTYGKPRTEPCSSEVGIIERKERRYFKNILGTHAERTISRSVLTGQELDNAGIIHPDSPKPGRDILFTLGGQQVEQVGTYAWPKANQQPRQDIDNRIWVKTSGQIVYLDISCREALRLCGYGFFDEINSRLAQVERRGGTFEEAMDVLRGSSKSAAAK